jgi:hypothetical protein
MLFAGAEGKSQTPERIDIQFGAYGIAGIA